MLNMTVEFSIIIPVLNEEKIINSLIEKLHSIFSSTEYEIIVVDGSIAKTTIGVIDDKRVIKTSSATGRAIQMNKGAELAKGDILIFLHADTLLPKDSPTLIKNALKGSIKVGSFDLLIDTKYKILQLISKTSRLRSRITKVPYGDQVHFFTRRFFFDVGRYKEIPIMEDVEIMKRIKRIGGRVFIIKTPAITSDRRWVKDGLIYGILRNALLTVLYFLGVSPEKLVSLYYRKNKGDIND